MKEMKKMINTKFRIVVIPERETHDRVHGIGYVLYVTLPICVFITSFFIPHKKYIDI